jgi:predicted ArsR family transcriptional regulator
MRDLDAIALLQDPPRRALYEYVIGQPYEVSRNEAAAAVGMQRTLAAFHLDRLADAGLLEVTYRRLGRRSGPGAGRPAKLYRRANTEHTYSAPPRDYALAARIFAQAIEDSGAEPALHAAARQQGVAAGKTLTHGSAAGLDPVVEDLTARGYEPYLEGQTVRLRNCPFHMVSQDFAAVACGMNLALLEGLLEGAGLGDEYAARLDPRPGDCCVSLISKTNTH